MNISQGKLVPVSKHDATDVNGKWR